MNEYKNLIFKKLTLVSEIAAKVSFNLIFKNKMLK
jgi:hypothetical protein